MDEYKNLLKSYMTVVVFGNGEDLCKNSRRIQRVKKSEPFYCSDFKSSVPHWNIDRALLSLQTFPDLQTPVYPFMKKLELDSVTLRNPSYQWIQTHLPSFQELYVHSSEPYPFCEIPLGSKVHTFDLEFDDRYLNESTVLPLVKLALTKEDGSISEKYFACNERTGRYQELRRILNSSGAEIDESSRVFYSVDLKFSSSLSKLLICKKNMSNSLKNIKRSI